MTVGDGRSLSVGERICVKLRSTLAAVPSVAADTLLFSSERQNTESALPGSRPAWDPEEPSCGNTTIAWQYYVPYGLGGRKSIDLDEVLPQYARYLW